MPDERAEAKPRVEKKPTTVTYGDLRDGDTILDRSGNEWQTFNVEHAFGRRTTLWLGTNGIRQHLIEKDADAEVTVLRVESHAEELARLEYEVDEHGKRVPAGEPLTIEETVEALDAEVVAEETAQESDARREAEATGEPVTLPTFAEMTDLEKRSHLYLLHGVYAADVKFRERLVELHDEAHASDADRVPHRHVEGAEVPA